MHVCVSVRPSLAGRGPYVVASLARDRKIKTKTKQAKATRYVNKAKPFAIDTEEAWMRNEPSIIDISIDMWIEKY